MDVRLALMCGTDIPVVECGIVLHQPRIEEIALMGELEFFQAVQCLTINQNMLMLQDNSVPSNLNNFQIFMMVMTAKETSGKKDSVLTLLSLLLPKYKISILPRSILLTIEGQMINIDESNFDIFQETIKQIFCFSSGPMDQSLFNPSQKDKKAQEIAQKLMRGRQRVAAQKGDNNTGIFAQYLSVVSVALGIPISDCCKYTMYQILDTVERYGLYVNWDLEIRARLAGAKSDSQPDNWMKPLH